MESGFLYKGRDPIYEMDSDEFINMLKDFEIELEHPNDLKGHSLDMWRAKWVFRIDRDYEKPFIIDSEKVKVFKENLI